MAAPYSQEEEYYQQILSDAFVPYSVLSGASALIDRIRQGVTRSMLEAFADSNALNRQEVAALLHISERTIQRLSGTDTLAPLPSDRFLQLLRVFAKGRAVFDSPAVFLQWLQSPSSALGGATPYSLLDTSVGIDEVYAVLHRLEQGVYS